MKLILIAVIICCAFKPAEAQHTFKAIITDTEKTPLPGATVVWKENGKTSIADSNGLVIIGGIAAGKQSFEITHTGFEERTLSLEFPLQTDTPIEIEMEEEHGHHEEVIITANRTSRTISNTPTRVEVISGEELDEKANMKPGDIRMLLSETTGIQTQQTSATSYNSSIRIQGLDGRYTQILKDGYPLYSGFSGGLSIMQIAPLDLVQVEVIKGSSSTLYGGGAIAGLVNLVSKAPVEEKEISFMANGTSALGLDLSGFYRQKFNKVGLTVYAARNTAEAYDPADIGLTAIPEYERYTFNPRLFFYGKNTTVNAGFSYIGEDRTGGSMEYIKEGAAGYFEKNNTERFTAQAGITHRLSERSGINFKNSYTVFDRLITIPSYRFDGKQRSSFSEISFNTSGTKSQWVAGANILTDDFEEKPAGGNPARNYHYNTAGLFIQNVWTASETFTLETGLRGDHVQQFGFEILPRFSAMFRFTPKITVRLGGGSGYKTPTIFTEDAERIHFRNILPINKSITENEQSLGGNFDVNYRTSLGEFQLSVNQLFFYTNLDRPLVLVSMGTDQGFRNSLGHIDTKGMETNVKLTYKDFKLFLGYTYADVNTHIGNVESWFPLTARHRLNNVLMFEQEEKIKIGLEAYYVSRQKLNDGTTGQPYWITGFMAEKFWEHFSVFINFENFTDTRQTRFDTIYTGSVDNPLFRDIYAPVDGFVINGGFKIRL